MLSRLPFGTQKKIIIISFVALPLLLLLTFSYYPALELVRLSFTNWDGMSPDKDWVGFKNYHEVFSNSEIFGVFKHNVAYFVVGIVQNIAAIYFAVVLNGKLKGKYFFRLLLFLPYILNGVAVAYAFGYVFDTTNGSLNFVLGKAGLGSETSWLGTEKFVNYTLASIGFWRFMGFNMVIYLAALQSIPGDLYEAASIDGANKWQQFRFITLPNIYKIVELNLFLTVTGALEVFDLPFVLTNGGPAGASETFVMKILETAFQFNNYGLASAMSVVLLIGVVIVISIQRFFLSRKGD
ncbi:multiple sugar transport system permease protein [Paenibacillus cellulosilyticus]|uniref:Multiple sugar transport system permease protein n=1 Tax=Paenibacillus cellulosilyticus TaxID=375489 RepID=A0A2V2YF56_9BACL|nr:sugar ABC transporter permease [Paenibacillus cellulosilyticus]PWV89425.1 multiple sugar transport system permease protein [Paenibacillus cellulosilyticus]QKS47284.1 sugar ABC transporter permease [Paenibacillus cellulosilyticus]